MEDNRMTMPIEVQAKCKPSACKSDIQGFDYKTSSGVGLQHYPSVNVSFQGKPAIIPNNIDVASDLVLIKSDYRSITASDYDWKLNESSPNERPSLLPCSSTLYIQRYSEKLKARPINPPRVLTTEQKDQFRPVVPLTENTGVVDRRQQYLCKVTTNTCLSPITTGFENDGRSRLLDPYNTTNQLEYHHHYKRDVDFYRSKEINITPLLAPRIKPVYDKLVFKGPCLSRTVYTPRRFLPHSGLKTETQTSFGLPLCDLLTFEQNVKYEGYPHLASRGEILSTPAMYRTEYNHVGNSWPVNACVQYNSKDIELIECET